MIVVRRGRPRDRGARSAEFDELLRALVNPAGQVQHRVGGTWRPPIDVFEQQNEITIVAEIAGMDREQIEITVEGDVVSIRGHRPDPSASEHRAFHEAHIAYGEFSAELYIPFPIDSDNAGATYENGFLTIHLPRIQGRTIVATSPDPRAPGTRSNA